MLMASNKRSVKYVSLKGFTLIELMVTLTIVAILSAAAFPSYQYYVDKSYRAQAEKIVADMSSKQMSLAMGHHGIWGDWESTVDTLNYSNTQDHCLAGVQVVALDNDICSRYSFTFKSDKVFAKAKPSSTASQFCLSGAGASCEFRIDKTGATTGWILQ